VCFPQKQPDSKHWQSRTRYERPGSNNWQWKCYNLTVKIVKIIIVLLLIATLVGLCREAPSVDRFEVDGIKIADDFESILSARGKADEVTQTLQGLGYTARIYNGCRLAIYGHTTIIIKEESVVGIQGKVMSFDSEALCSAGDSLSDAVERVAEMLGEPAETVGPSSFPPFETSTSWEVESFRWEILSVDEAVTEVRLLSDPRAARDRAG